ncbi:MAG: ETX/MTX2 family pore-forming toxin [Spiroplasma sp.]|nr:ETX/MTX2 family pore-forming toxin [Spiroplasma sp.]
MDNDESLLVNEKQNLDSKGNDADLMVNLNDKPIDNFVALLYFLDQQVGKVDWVDPITTKGYKIELSKKKHIQECYDKFFKNKTGSIVSLKGKEKYETVIQRLESTYKNYTASEQIYSTQSFIKTITNNYTFSWSIKEDIELKASVSVPFLKNSLEVTTKFSSQQSWSKSEIITETLTNPSQAIKVSPDSQKKVFYIIKQKTYHEDGCIRYSVNLDDTISSSVYWKNGVWANTSFSMKEIIKLLAVKGYADKIKFSAKEFSIISVDDPNNPVLVTINLPISWESQGGAIEIDVVKESLLGQFVGLDNN